METLFGFAREAERPLCVYATGLLARAMSNQEVAAGYRPSNLQLVSFTHEKTSCCSLCWNMISKICIYTKFN